MRLLNILLYLKVESLMSMFLSVRICVNSFVKKVICTIYVCLLSIVITHHHFIYADSLVSFIPTTLQTIA